MTKALVVAGELLVAAPHLADPNFRRAVVLLLNRDDDGALGVVLNRPLDAGVDAVLPDWHDVVSQPATLFQGGPVGLDGALAVATMLPGADRYPGVTRVAGPFGVVDLDADPEEGGRAITGMRVFAGYAGWGPGQLEAEIADGDWFVLPADPADVVTPAPEALWRRVPRRQGGAMAIISTFPQGPSLN